MKTEKDEISNTLVRLNALMKAGFRINEPLSQHVGDIIWLKHPSVNRLIEAEVTLYEDGTVIYHDPLKNENYELRIESYNDDAFNGFLKRVPMPTYSEKIRDSVTIFSIWTGFLLITIIISGILGYFVKEVRSMF